MASAIALPATAEGKATRRARGEGPGWEFVHVAIDDNSRIAFAKDAQREERSAIAFLKAALAYQDSLGMKVDRVMTDNGSCYKSFAFRRLRKRLASNTSAPSPTRRKPTVAERFIQTAPASGPMPRPIITHGREPTAAILAAPIQLA